MSLAGAASLFGDEAVEFIGELGEAWGSCAGGRGRICAAGGR